MVMDELAPIDRFLQPPSIAVRFAAPIVSGFSYKPYRTSPTKLTVNFRITAF
jgi:hypothetical protein